MFEIMPNLNRQRFRYLLFGKVSYFEVQNNTHLCILRKHELITLKSNLFSLNLFKMYAY